jgi:hypothetical protein
MRRCLCLTMLSLLAMPAAAVSRVELSIGRIEAPQWQAQAVSVDWHPDAGLRAKATLRAGMLPEMRSDLRCDAFDAAHGIACSAGRLQMAGNGWGRFDASFDLHLQTMDRWSLRLRSSQARLDYNAPDGRIASEKLAVQVSAQARRSDAGLELSFDAAAPSGQAYVEPLFLDLGTAPLRVQGALRWPMRPDSMLQLDRLTLRQHGVATLAVNGELDPRAAATRHRLQARLDIEALDAVASHYLVPLLAGTRLQDLAAAGRAQLSATLMDGAVGSIDAELQDIQFDSQRLGLKLEGLAGHAHWREAGTAPPSQLRWQTARVVALPIGAAQLELQALSRGVRLRQPVRVPVLDGALRVEALSLDRIGSDNPAATFDASLDPIDLALLGRTLGWPEFGGRLSGRLPGLRLQDRELSLDGTLSADVFDGRVTVEQVHIIDPFGVLPRVRADLRLRQLDLEAITRAFSFGRITGRLDGDFEQLRLLGWEPVAMNARLYSTPGDRSTRRISQRAIDNISSIGGGPTGVLSRGVMRLFEDFAYAQIGWSCVLANGVCRMDGIAPSTHRQDGQSGYVLVQGRWLPRIDVIGYTRNVSWNTFVSQLMAVRNAQGVEVR